MSGQIKSIRPFIGAENFQLCREFYRDFGFTETILLPNMSYFFMQHFGFYLQDAYVKDWIDNSMIFLEVEDIDSYWSQLVEKKLSAKYKTVRVSAIKPESWGKECFVHDPSGILWHIGSFSNKIS